MVSFKDSVSLLDGAPGHATLLDSQVRECSTWNILGDDEAEELAGSSWVIE